MISLPYEIALASALSGTDYESDDMRFLTTTESTIKDIARAIAQGKPAGFTVFALEQTQGRGGGIDKDTGKVRDWWSAKGNLLMTRIIDADMDFPKEMEFIAMLAVGEICASQIPRGQTLYKFANDILIDGHKVSGGLLLRHPQSKNVPRVASLSIGLNLVAPPPSSAIRDESVAKGGTCLRDHGVDLDVAGFMRLFDVAFSNLVQLHRENGFTAILQRIGFADAAGIVTLHAHKDKCAISGTYAGFEADEIGPDTYANFIFLKQPDGVIKRLAFTDYRAEAVITRDAVSVARPIIASEAPHA